MKIIKAGKHNAAYRPFCIYPEISKQGAKVEIADVAIIGAGASGLMCAAQAAKRNRRVIVLDNGPKPGRKILMAGGGKCNFTNQNLTPDNFICSNPHFVKSALSRFSQMDFIEQVKSSKIAFHERSHGQLFCDESAACILDMLLDRCRRNRASIATHSLVSAVRRDQTSGRFYLTAGKKIIQTTSLVIATGGVSIPAAGATPFGYQVAEQFGIPVVPPRPGLVPLTLAPEDKAIFQSLSGISVPAQVSCGKAAFQEQLLFTHRGLSGPVILQISSYWRPGDMVTIDLLPHLNLADRLKHAKARHPKKQVRSLVCNLLPRRLVDARLASLEGLDHPVSSLSSQTLSHVAQAFHHWQVKPGGTEGNRTAEVTVGGVDCHGIFSKTFESAKIPGLYFIGEVLDVTGQLGGYNLQWAWSSGFCAGQWV
jgi:predicted Rossmann fold flavoprotein